MSLILTDYWLGEQNGGHGVYEGQGGSFLREFYVHEAVKYLYGLGWEGFLRGLADVEL